MIPGTKADSVSNHKCARRGICERSDSLVANNSPPAHWTSSSAQALEASSSFRDSRCVRKMLRSPASAVRKDLLGGRGTSWGRQRQLREAAWGNGGGRGKGEQRLAKKTNKVAGLAVGSPTPKR